LFEGISTQPPLPNEQVIRKREFHYRLHSVQISNISLASGIQENTINSLFFNINFVIISLSIKVKPSHYRPEQAVRLPAD
jgi:hypothetical protein